MSDKHRLHDANFPSAREELDHSETDHPPAYKLAFTDQDFLLSEELRGVRFHLELQKPEMILRQHGIESTIAVFGSARFPSPEDAKQNLAAAEASGDPAAIRAARPSCCSRNPRAPENCVARCRPRRKGGEAAAGRSGEM